MTSGAADDGGDRGLEDIIADPGNSTRQFVHRFGTRAKIARQVEEERP